MNRKIIYSALAVFGLSLLVLYTNMGTSTGPEYWQNVSLVRDASGARFTGQSDFTKIKGNVEIPFGMALARVSEGFYGNFRESTVGIAKAVGIEWATSGLEMGEPFQVLNPEHVLTVKVPTVETANANIEAAVARGVPFNSLRWAVAPNGLTSIGYLKMFSEGKIPIAEGQALGFHDALSHGVYDLLVSEADVNAFKAAAKLLVDIYTNTSNPKVKEALFPQGGSDRETRSPASNLVRAMDEAPYQMGQGLAKGFPANGPIEMRWLRGGGEAGDNSLTEVLNSNPEVRAEAVRLGLQSQMQAVIDNGKVTASTPEQMGHNWTQAEKVLGVAEAPAPRPTAESEKSQGKGIDTEPAAGARGLRSVTVMGSLDKAGGVAAVGDLAMDIEQYWNNLQNAKTQAERDKLRDAMIEKYGSMLALMGPAAAIIPALGVVGTVAATGLALWGLYVTTQRAYVIYGTSFFDFFEKPLSLYFDPNDPKAETNYLVNAAAGKWQKAVERNAKAREDYNGTFGMQDYFKTAIRTNGDAQSIDEMFLPATGTTFVISGYTKGFKASDVETLKTMVYIAGTQVRELLLAGPLNPTQLALLKALLDDMQINILRLSLMRNVMGANNPYMSSGDLQAFNDILAKGRADLDKVTAGAPPTELVNAKPPPPSTQVSVAPPATPPTTTTDSSATAAALAAGAMVNGQIIANTTSSFQNLGSNFGFSVYGGLVGGGASVTPDITMPYIPPTQVTVYPSFSDAFPPMVVLGNVGDQITFDFNTGRIIQFQGTGNSFIGGITIPGITQGATEYKFQ